MTHTPSNPRPSLCYSHPLKSPSSHPSLFTHQVYVYGESIKSTLIALVVLDEEYLAASPPPSFATIPLSQLPASSEFTEFVREAMLRLGQEELNSLEQVRQLILS